MAKIIVFAGSSREDSFNFKLAKFACSELKKNKQIEAELINVADYEAPLYNGDLEANQGIPNSIQEFQKHLLSADAFLIASPEYNSSITPLLKNLIDWSSRPSDVAKGLECYRGKIVGLMSASPGALGGIRGLRHVREILSNIGVLVIPEQVCVGSCMNIISEDGQITDEATIARLNNLITSLAQTTINLRTN